MCSRFRRIAGRLVGIAGLFAAVVATTASVAAQSGKPSPASALPAVITPTAGSPVSGSPVPGSPAASAATPPQAVLPNGATALTETYGDWQVVCAVQGPAKRCAAHQEQVNQQSRQVVLTIELAPLDDRLVGVAMLPFGLALDSGVALQIDDAPTSEALRFKTCLPAGCMVALDFDGRMAAALRAGTTLKAKVVVVDGGSDAALAISLKGLTNAIDRTAALLATPSDRVATLKK